MTGAAGTLEPVAQAASISAGSVELSESVLVCTASAVAVACCFAALIAALAATALRARHFAHPLERHRHLAQPYAETTGITSAVAPSWSSMSAGTLHPAVISGAGA